VVERDWLNLLVGRCKTNSRRALDGLVGIEGQAGNMVGANRALLGNRILVSFCHDSRQRMS